jgi:hypothetical protein
VWIDPHERPRHVTHGQGYISGASLLYMGATRRQYVRYAGGLGDAIMLDSLAVTAIPEGRVRSGPMAPESASSRPTTRSTSRYNRPSKSSTTPPRPNAQRDFARRSRTPATRHCASARAAPFTSNTSPIRLGRSFSSRARGPIRRTPTAGASPRASPSPKSTERSKSRLASRAVAPSTCTPRRTSTAVSQSGSTASKPPSPS